MKYMVIIGCTLTRAASAILSLEVCCGRSLADDAIAALR